MNKVLSIKVLFQSGLSSIKIVFQLKSSFNRDSYFSKEPISAEEREWKACITKEEKEHCLSI